MKTMRDVKHVIEMVGASTGVNCLLYMACLSFKFSNAMRLLTRK